MKLLETKRTILRAFNEDDLSELTQLMTDPQIMQYTGFRRPQSKEVIKKSLLSWIEAGKGELGVWCAQDKETKNLIGWFMLKDTGHEYPELGFMLAKKFWGIGLATEIASALAEYGLKKLNYKKIIATTVSENQASIAVLKKIGMTRSDLKRADDPDYDIYCFELAKKLE